VDSLLVAAPGGDPSVVHGSLDAWAKAERSDVLSQQHDFEQLIASKSVDDPAFLDQYRQEVARLTRLRQTLDPKGDIVFGAVVVGDAPALRALAAATADVRLVDVAPGAAVPPDGDMHGLRPEEINRASDPSTRP
ncbi:MAG TPA: hypothetical protein VKJ07_07030, partial [Mycobacteriales bacterium]|nr:hypothetical protein [Mycobacteriales bacterium]